MLVGFVYGRIAGDEAKKYSVICREYAPSLPGITVSQMQPLRLKPCIK